MSGHDIVNDLTFSFSLLLDPASPPPVIPYGGGPVSLPEDEELEDGEIMEEGEIMDHVEAQTTSVMMAQWDAEAVLRNAERAEKRRKANRRSKGRAARRLAIYNAETAQLLQAEEAAEQESQRLVQEARQREIEEEEQRKEAERKRHEEERARKQETEREKYEAVKEFLQALLSTENIHLHFVQKKPELLKKLQDLEARRNSPLSSNDPEFPNDEIKWIYEPGIHYVYDTDEKCIVFASRITPWDQFASPEKLDKTRTALAVLHDWSRCVNPINTNAGHNKPSHDANAVRQLPVLDLESDEEEIRPAKTSTPRVGRLYAVGWHGSQESLKTLVYYAPKRDANSVALYEETMHKLPQVAELYRENMFSIMPGAAQDMADEAMRLQIPSYDTLSVDGESPHRPFANSLTLTAQCFANYIHRDKDWSPIVFGMWWVAGMKRRPKVRFWWDLKYDHKNVRGGEFLLAEYGIGVKHDKAQGLVENFWRGMQDWHCTLASECEDDCTRFGSSIQLTTKGVQAVLRYLHDHRGSQSIVTDAFDRVETGQERNAGKRKARPSI